MKTLSLTRAALAALVLGSASFTATFAQTPSTPPPAPATQAAQGPLTPEEKEQLKKDTEQALNTNPDLKTESDNLRKQRETLKSQGASATADDRKAFRVQDKDFQEKLRAAVVKLDPSAAPIYAKIDAFHQARHAAKNN